MAKRKHIGIREFKNRASHIVDEVRERDQSYIVTKRGEPVAVLRPWNADDDRVDRVARARELLATLSGLAERIALVAGKRSGVAAVSGQRR